MKINNFEKIKDVWNNEIIRNGLSNDLAVDTVYIDEVEVFLKIYDINFVHYKIICNNDIVVSIWFDRGDWKVQLTDDLDNTTKPKIITTVIKDMQHTMRHLLLEVSQFYVDNGNAYTY